MHTLAGAMYKHKLFDEGLTLYERAFTGVKDLLRSNNNKVSCPFLGDYM